MYVSPKKSEHAFTVTKFEFLAWSHFVFQFNPRPIKAGGVGDCLFLAGAVAVAGAGAGAGAVAVAVAGAGAVAVAGAVAYNRLLYFSDFHTG